MSRQVVLVVDDDRHDRELYGNLLWYNGFDVLFAEEAEEGVRLARESQPDLLLLDMVLPGDDGLRVCSRLKADPKTARIPVIAITGLRRPGLEKEARATGCARYFEKPVSPLTVMREIESMIGRPPLPVPDSDDAGASSGSPPA